MTDSNSAPTPEVSLSTSLKFEMHFQLGTPYPVGPSPTGNRIIFPVIGGTVKGNGIEAEALPGAADWFNLGGVDGYGKLDVRAAVKTKEGEILTLSYDGHLEMNQLVNNVFEASPEARSTTFYEQTFMISMNIETSSKRLEWVNRKIFVGRGRFEIRGEEVGLVYQVFTVE